MEATKIVQTLGGLDYFCCKVIRYYRVDSNYHFTGFEAALSTIGVR